MCCTTWPLYQQFVSFSPSFIILFLSSYLSNFVSACLPENWYPDVVLLRLISTCLMHEYTPHTTHSRLKRGRFFLFYDAFFHSRYDIEVQVVFSFFFIWFILCSDWDGYRVSSFTFLIPSFRQNLGSWGLSSFSRFLRCLLFCLFISLSMMFLRYQLGCVSLDLFS